MFGLTRWEPAGISRLREDMEDLFDRFFDREDEWAPSRMMRSLRGFQRELDDLFGDFFGGEWRPAAAREGGGFWPRFRSQVEDGEYVVRAELPGVSPEELEVTVTENTLTVRGERKQGGPEGGEYRRFSHSFALPEPADPDKVKARLANGILEVRMPASPKLVGKRVQVEVGAGEEKKQLKAA